MISAGDFRNGVTIEFEGNIYQIIEFQHVKPGKGAAFVRTKLKNIKSGGVVEKTFRPTEKCPTARIERRDIVRQPIETWKDELVNDFEAPIFAMHPELAAIKQRLYDVGAVYAAMSGSGSALFGIFREQPTGLEKEFEGMFYQVMKL